MTFRERYDLLYKIAQYIQRERTGTPDEFIQKCKITSRDVLFYHIKILRDFTIRDGVNIIYDNDRKTYFFSPRGKFTDFKFIKDNDNLR
jgi:hypothetical protein